MSDFSIPTRVRIAPGCSTGLTGAVIGLGGQRVLFVTDSGLASGPLVRRALDLFTAHGLDWELFVEVPSNPRTATAEKLATLTRPGDVLVGFGGGSVIDATKAAAMLATNGGQARDWVGKTEFPNHPLPLIAVPTTCGTGSEVTWVSVLSDTEHRTKISIKGRQMFPDLALVDADLIRKLPPELIASTGMDALTHALEATTGKPRNPISDMMAETAISLSLRYLLRAARDSNGDHEAREGIARASTLAGLAFGSTDVGGVHCLSESLGGLYDVAHGLANARLLVPVMRSHGEHVEQRLAQLDSMNRPDGSSAPQPSGEAFLDRIEALLAELPLPQVSALGIQAVDHERIAQMAIENGSNSSNPREMGTAQYRAILESL